MKTFHIINSRMIGLLLGLAAILAPLRAQTVISGGGNYISGPSFYLGTHTGSPTYGFVQTYDDAVGNTDAVKFHANRIAAWLWENYDGTTTWPSMRLDLSNNLILYNGTNEGVKLNPVSKSLTLGGSSGAILTASGTALSTNGAFTIAGAFTNTNGSFTGGSSGLTLNAGGTNQNITLTPSGTGYTILNGNVGIGTSSPGAKLEVYAPAAEAIRIRGDNSYLALFNTAGTRQGYFQGGSGNVVLASDTGVVAFNANGSERMRIDTGGNVGIGTSGPLVKFDLKLTTNQHVGIYNNGGVTTLAGLNDAASLASLRLEGSPLTLGGAGGAEHMRINSSGYVGIGTTSPPYKLTVSGGFLGISDGASGPYAYVQGATAAAYFGSADGRRASFGNSENWETLTVDGGNVGIGTTSPSYLLHINGQGKANSFVVANPSYAGQLVLGSGANYEPALASDTNLLLVAGNGANLIHKIGATEMMRVTAAGNVGIGTASPQAKLQVGSWNFIKDGTWAPPVAPDAVSGGERIVFYQGSGWKTAIGMDGQNGIWFQSHTPAGQVAYQWFTGGNATAPVEKMRLMENGNVGIGTTSPGTYKLAVNGSIHAKEVVVDLTGWSDFVFDQDYRLAPLSEVERHIKAKKHLPGIPSAQEVADHGVSLGEMQSRLLAKIEELTLHQIAQEKEIAALKTRLAQMESGPPLQKHE